MKRKRRIKNCFMIEHRRAVMKASACMWKEHFTDWFDNDLYPKLPTILMLIGIFIGSLFLTLIIYWNICTKGVTP